jgi:UDP-N-acetyl-2-amino-2-deoxyglucuronate dehydrogenase
MEQLAKVFRRSLGYTVDVFGNGPDLLGHPRGRSSVGRHEGVAKDARRAREDERLNAVRNGLFQQVKSAGDVDVDELLPAVGGDMRLVNSGCVEDHLHAEVRSFEFGQGVGIPYHPQQHMSMNIETDSRSPARTRSFPLRIAMIGSGAIARLHLPGFINRPDAVRLSRICELNPEAAANVARQLPYPVSVERDYRDLIGADDVDAALVALPHYLHYPVAAELAGAGIPVLVEKPLACTLEEARRLQLITQKSGAAVICGQMLRYSREANFLRDWIAENPNNFGSLRTFDLQSWQNILAYTHNSSTQGHWLLDGEKAGGGVVISLAIHQLDLIRFLSGLDFVEVIASGRFDEPFHAGAESCAVALLKMSGGASGALHTNYLAPRVPYCEALTLFGQYGTIIQHADSIGQYRGYFRYASVANRATEKWTDQYEGFERVVAASDSTLSDDAFTNQLVAFADSVIRGSPSLNSISRNFNTLACIAALYTSIRTGRPIPVETELTTYD